MWLAPWPTLVVSWRVLCFSGPYQCYLPNRTSGSDNGACAGATPSGKVGMSLPSESKGLTPEHHDVARWIAHRVPRLCFSCLSDAASGLSDGNEGGPPSGGRHEGRSLKRHQRRSVRSRSRHEKFGKAKLNVLNVRGLFSPVHCSAEPDGFPFSTSVAPPSCS